MSPPPADTNEVLRALDPQHRGGARSRLRLGRVHQPDPGAREVRNGLESESRSKLSRDVKLLPDKPSLGRTLEQAHKSLRAGGRLICMGPNIRYLPGAYWDFWDHYVPLWDRSLGEALQLAGFAVEWQTPRFLPYSMSQGFQPPIALLRAYLSLPIVWSLFGKQFLVVAKKT